jgi:hypothetical protein
LTIMSSMSVALALPLIRGLALPAQVQRGPAGENPGVPQP